MLSLNINIIIVSCRTGEAKFIKNPILSVVTFFSKSAAAINVFNSQERFQTLVQKELANSTTKSIFLMFYDLRHGRWKNLKQVNTLRLIFLVGTKIQCPISTVFSTNSIYIYIYICVCVCVHILLHKAWR